MTQEEDEWENDRLAKVRNKVLHGHIGGVNSCSFFNHNSKLVFSAGDDATVRIWNTGNSSFKQILSGHKDEVTCCRCTHDDRNIVSVGLDKLLILWDVSTQKPILQAAHEGMVMSCDISHDGKYILTGTDLDNTVYLWDVRTRKAITKLSHHTNTVTCVRFAHSSYRFCSTAMDKKALVFDMLDYKVRKTQSECKYVYIIYSPLNNASGYTKGKLLTRLIWLTGPLPLV